ncbi:hypothetical protein MPTK1_1g02050 [Marchantia polymorpha subsp. ruderalis]|uniref:Uncharacterized protein n=1 Tax=Marchantia polymorpha subsp. ruderalis TaxID=1480154 RepID=A0AAF6AKL3_MARPO|nr:hypothetical protein Mp_1g02050 [Marchantia polymorpha subsp. ruderalis]
MRFSMMPRRQDRQQTTNSLHWPLKPWTCMKAEGWHIRLSPTGIRAALQGSNEQRFGKNTNHHPDSFENGHDERPEADAAERSGDRTAECMDGGIARHIVLLKVESPHCPRDRHMHDIPDHLHGPVQAHQQPEHDRRRIGHGGDGSRCSEAPQRNPSHRHEHGQVRDDVARRILARDHDHFRNERCCERNPANPIQSNPKSTESK